MIKIFLKSIIEKNKTLILDEGVFLNNFFTLLFKQINTKQKWTSEDIIILKRHLLHLSAYIPVLTLFLLPGGGLLLPFLAEILDRRKHERATNIHANSKNNQDMSYQDMNDFLLSIQNLNLQFKTQSGTLPILYDIGFSIKRSQVFGLVGESGCGKSLTALSIMRLLPKNAELKGNIFFNNKDIISLTEADMRMIRGKEISMIFQEPMTSLNPVLTVGYQISEVLTTHNKISKKEALDTTIELMKAVMIPSPELRVRDYPHQMSGGMRQRVMIAMAIACKPKLLIADEPTTALDVTIQAEILALINRLRQEMALSMLLITHDLAIISEMADISAIMYTGRIVEHANTQELLHNPLHPYTKGLLNSLPQQRNRELIPIKGFVPDPKNLPKGCKFANRCSLADMICNETEPSLEEKSEGHLVRCYKV